MVLISFCIPVYNQSDLVRNCVESILMYEGNDIEIVISDDCSREDIRSLASQYHDSRISYYRNEKNLGHDKNIIAGFERAQGQYVFLLRSRDKIIASKISKMIDMLSSIDNVSYFTGGAVDENGCPMLKYQTTVYEKGWEALRAHNQLYIHPSGSIYRRDLLELPMIKKHLSSTVDNVEGSFIVHNLMRIQLSQKGRFITTEDNIWVYSNTKKAKDVAVNSMKNRESVYSPRLCTIRFDCEALWCKNILNEEMFAYEYSALLSRYLKQCTWGYKLSIQDKEMQRHYNYKTEKVNVSVERMKFLNHAEILQKQLFEDDHFKMLKSLQRKSFVNNVTVDAAKYYIIKWMRGIRIEWLAESINRLRYLRGLRNRKRQGMVL